MSPVQPRVPPFTSAGYLFDCYYYVVIDSKFSVSTGLLPKCGEIKTFYPTGSRFFARLPLTFVTHPLRCSYLSIFLCCIVRFLDTSADVSRSVPSCRLVWRVVSLLTYTNYFSSFSRTCFYLIKSYSSYWRFFVKNYS